MDNDELYASDSEKRCAQLPRVFATQLTYRLTNFGKNGIFNFDERLVRKAMEFSIFNLRTFLPVVQRYKHSIRNKQMLFAFLKVRHPAKSGTSASPFANGRHVHSKRNDQQRRRVFFSRSRHNRPTESKLHRFKANRRSALVNSPLPFSIYSSGRVFVQSRPVPATRECRE